MGILGSMLCVRCAGTFCLPECVLTPSVCVYACWRLLSVCIRAGAFLQRQLRAAWQIVAAGRAARDGRLGVCTFIASDTRQRPSQRPSPRFIASKGVRSTRQKQEARVKGHPRGHPPGPAHFGHFSRRHTGCGTEAMTECHLHRCTPASARCTLHSVRCT